MNHNGFLMAFSLGDGSASCVVHGDYEHATIACEAKERVVRIAHALRAWDETLNEVPMPRNDGEKRDQLRHFAAKVVNDGR